MKGVSLLELLVAMGLLSLLLLVSVPVTTGFLSQNKLLIRKNEIISALNYARNKAVTSHNTLILKSISGGGDWSQGMYLYDVRNTKEGNADRGKILHVWKWSNNSISVAWHGFHSDHYISFNPLVSKLAASGHFTIRQNKTNHSEKIVLNRFGRILL